MKTSKAEDSIDHEASPAPRPNASEQARLDKRAAALRDNLQRRKAQSRGRAALDGDKAVDLPGQQPESVAKT